MMFRVGVSARSRAAIDFRGKLVAWWVGSLVAAAMPAGALAGPSMPAAAPDEIHWTLTGQTSVTLSWRGSDNTVLYGLTPAYGQTASGTTPTPVPVSSAGPFWEARLTGLQEGRLYHYSIGGGPDHTFRTPPPRGASGFTVVVEGDIGDVESYPEVAVVQSMIAEAAPDFCLITGDLTYGNDHGEAAVDQHFNDVMVWSQDAAYMPAWGNHDWETSSTDDLRNYKGRFDLPNSQTSPGAPSAGCCGDDWYWFDYGNARFIAFPEPYTSETWDDWQIKARQLMDDAQADPAITFVVTFGHRPAYSSGNHGSNNRLRTMLNALAATHDKFVLCLSAHSHDYERSHPQSGVTHLVTGIGGATLQHVGGSCMWEGGCPPPSWSAFRALHHGYVKLRFLASRIEGQAICGPAVPEDNDITCVQGSVMDAFVIQSATVSGWPVVTAPDTASAPEGRTISLGVTAVDPDGDPIASLTADMSGLPPGHGATFTPSADHTSGVFTWTPRYGDADGSPYPVTFVAANQQADSTITRIDVLPGDVEVLGPNLVGNPSFETSTTGWKGYGGASIARFAGGHEGDYALEMTGSGSIQKFGVNDSPTWVEVGLEAGTRYRFSAWVRSASSSEPAVLRVREYQGGVRQGPVVHSTPVALSPSWQLLTVDHVTLTSGAFLDFQVLCDPAIPDQVFETDDISIRTVTRGGVTGLPTGGDPAGGLRAIMHPNPGGPRTALSFATSRDGRLSARIFDASGRHARTLLDEAHVPAGNQRLHFDGRGHDGERLRSGVYFYLIESIEGSARGRFVIVH